MATHEMNVATYIRERSDELQRLSKDARLHLLEHIFGMAALEAAKYESEMRPPVLPQFDKLQSKRVDEENYIKHRRSTLQEALEDLVNVAGNRLEGKPRAAFYIPDEFGTGLHRVAGMNAAYGAHTAGFRISNQSIACGLAAAIHYPVITRDVAHDPAWTPWRWLASAFDYRGCWSFPIEGRGRKMLGTFSLYFKEPAQASERDMLLAATITDTAAEIIGRRA